MDVLETITLSIEKQWVKLYWARNKCSFVEILEGEHSNLREKSFEIIIALLWEFSERLIWLSAFLFYQTPFRYSAGKKTFNEE